MFMRNLTAGVSPCERFFDYLIQGHRTIDAISSADREPRRKNV